MTICFEDSTCCLKILELRLLQTIVQAGFNGGNVSEEMSFRILEDNFEVKIVHILIFKLLPLLFEKRIQEHHKASEYTK